MLDSKHLGVASTSMEVMIQSCGLEDATYLSTSLGLTGAGQPSSPITPSSTSLSFAGDTGFVPHSSSTRYQWRELYVAWRLATVSPDLRQILVFPKKGEPSTRPMVWPSWTRSWNLSLQTIANTTYIYASGFSSSWFLDTRPRNCD